ncbi:MAG TPA: ABC transporter permease [Candidatus Choladousia intestinavium]|uniref:ABC transporter permease n=1 Tax=Candidatus Choladousia intestinavium TaxID=2840727 RepID=A0A9D1DBL3_9FIRM|nr:ABC transporter permease [Candidatus Choladousia intestinavium]
MDEKTVKIRIKKKSQAGDIWRRFLKNKTAVLGLVIFAAIMLAAIFADFIVSYDKGITQNILERLQGPSAAHWFGTDNFGRDIFARVIHGSRNSLLVGIGAVAIGITVGGLLGSIAGFYGGKIDSVIGRIMDTIMSIPLMLLVLSLVTALGNSLINVLLAMMIANIPQYVRIVRAAILSVVGQDYIEAAKACGTSNFKIIIKHVIPNAIGPIIVQATMAVGTMILNAAGISFLGMGIQPPTPEWGSMLNEGKQFMTMYPYIVVFPGIAIGLTALALNLMGDGLRDALDPKLKD